MFLLALIAVIAGLLLLALLFGWSVLPLVHVRVSPRPKLKFSLAEMLGLLLIIGVVGSVNTFVSGTGRPEWGVIVFGWIIYGCVWLLAVKMLSDADLPPGPLRLLTLVFTFPIGFTAAASIVIGFGALIFRGEDPALLLGVGAIPVLFLARVLAEWAAAHCPAAIPPDEPGPG